MRLIHTNNPHFFFFYLSLFAYDLKNIGKILAENNMCIHDIRIQDMTIFKLEERHGYFLLAIER